AHARRARVLLVLSRRAEDRRAGRARGLVPATAARSPERLGGPAHRWGAVLARDGAAGVARGPPLVPRPREGNLAGADPGHRSGRLAAFRHAGGGIQPGRAGAVRPSPDAAAGGE